MDNAQLALIFSLAIWAGGALLSLLLLWTIIRSAVLSALRKHSDELAQAQRRQRQRAANTQSTPIQYAQQPTTPPHAY